MKSVYLLKLLPLFPFMEFPTLRVPFFSLCLLPGCRLFSASEDSTPPRTVTSWVLWTQEGRELPSLSLLHDDHPWLE